MIDGVVPPNVATGVSACWACCSRDLPGQLGLPCALDRPQVLDLGTNGLKQCVALRKLRLDRALFRSTLRDDLLLLGLRVMQSRFFARDVRAKHLDVADDGAALVVDAVDVVEPRQ